MPSVRYSIDSSGAVRGAQVWSTSVDRIVADARRAAQAVLQVDRAMQAMRQAAGGAAMLVRITQANQQVARTSQQTAGAVNALTLSMRNMSSAAALSFGPLSGLGSRFTAIGSLATRNSLALGGVIAAATGVATALGASIKAAADFEAGMLRVAKVTDSSNAELARMSSDVLKLSSTLGIPAGELAKIEQGAAQLGIRGSQNLSAFAEQVAMLTRTSDLGAEQATQALARLMNITGESAGNIAGMAAALTDLGNKSAASEAQILSMSLELGRGTAAFDVSSQQLLSLGAALAEVGEKSERSATAVSQVFIAITDAASGGEKLDDFARLIGVTAEQFQELAKRDIGEVFKRILGVLAQQGPNAVQTLRDLELGSARNTKVLLSLAEVLDRYDRNLGLVAEQYKNPTAAAQEFARMNDSVTRQLEIAGVQFENLGTIIGTVFLPGINDALQTLNAFLLLVQGIEPKAGEANTMIRLLAGAVRLVAENIGPAASGFKNFVENMALPPGVNTAIRTLELLYGLIQSPPTPAELFPDERENIRVLTDAVRTMDGVMSQSSQAPRTVAAALDALAASANRATAAVDRTSGAVDSVLNDLRAQAELKQLELKEGKAAAETQKIINEMQKKGGKEAVQVSEEQRAAIMGLVQANLDLDNRLRSVSTGQKAVAKEAKAATRAFEELNQGLDGVIRDLEKDLKLTGLNESEAAVVELQAKLEELRVKAVEGGADEARAREAVNATYERALPILEKINQQKAEEFRNNTLENLAREIELRRIEVTEGTAAANTQRVINEAKDAGIEITDEFIAKVRQQNEELENFREKSTVVADAFEDFIAGIAQGTQDLSLDGIADAFKAAFAASVKEKLKFDEIFKGNLFDLVDFAGDLFSGGAIDVAGLFSFGSGSGGGSGGGGGSIGGGIVDTGLQIIGQNADGSFIFGGGYERVTDDWYAANVSDTGMAAGGGGFSWGGALAGGAAGYGSAQFFGNQWITKTGLPRSLKQVEAEAISQLRGINQVIGTILGAVFGGLFGGGSMGGGLVGGITGAFTSLVGTTWADRIDRDALRNRGFGAWGGAGPVGFDKGGWDLIGATDPLASFVMWQLLGLPTLGTAYRRAGEGVLDASKVFGHEGLQGLLGDWTRSSADFNGRGIEMALERGFSEVEVDKIRGATEALFGKIFEDELPEDMGRLALAQGRGMAEFLSRGLAEGMTFDELFGSLRAFAEESGITLMTTIKELPSIMAGVTAQAQEFGGVDAMAAGREGAEAYARELLGITALFQGDFPVGVNLASIALQTLEKDGVKAFENLDHEGRERLQNLTEDAELFQDVVAHLVEQGFTIDTEEFEEKLKAITASAQFLGENFGTFFQFENVGVGIQAVMQNLKQTVLGTYQEIASKQLFEGTGFAGAFEPVFAVLNRIEEFDLTTATGSKGFMDLLLPALAEGKANLEEYIPILQLMADNWKEIEKIIDEAMEPDEFEKAAIAVEGAFSNLGAVLNDSIVAGIAVLEDGGTWDQAVSVFKGTFGTGVTTSFREAVFNAIVDQAFLQPLIATYTPAFQYVVAAGMIHGFDDPRVQAAFNDLMGDLTSDAEKLGLAVFKARVDSEGITSDIEKAFNDAADIAIDWANDLQGTLSGAFDAAFDVLAGGGSRDAALQAWNEALGGSTQDAVLRGIVMALINAAIIEPFIKEWAPIIQFWAAGAMAKGINDPKVQEAAEILFGPNGPLMKGIEALGPIGIDFYGRIIGFEDENGNKIDPNGKTPTGGAKDPVPGFATGGSIAHGSAFVVGERGPELVLTDGHGSTIIPIGYDTMNTLLGGGVAGYAHGTTSGGRGRTHAPPPEPETRPRGGQDPPDRNPTTRPPIGAPITDPRDPRHPDYQDPSGGGGGAGGTASESDTIKALAAAFDAAMEKGKDFVTEFSRSLGDSVRERLTDAVISGFGKQKDVAKESAAIDALVTKAENLAAQGKLDESTAASIASQIAAHTTVIAERAKQMEPILAQFRVAEQIADALGSIDFADALSGLATLDLSDSAALEGWRDGLRQSTDEAILEGVTNALLTSGPLADTIRAFTEDLNKQMTEALADGTLTEAEAAALGQGAAEGSAKIQEQMLALAPVFQALGINLGDAATTAMQQAGDLIGSSLSSIMNDPAKLNYEGFAQALRESIYQNVASGLIDAFVESAVINGALAGPLGAIQTIFDQIGQKQLSVAEANSLIAEQMAAINGVLLDPAFKESISTLVKGIGDIGSKMNAFPPKAREVAVVAEDVSDAVKDAEKDVCAGKCALKERTIDLGSTVLDSSGRLGDIQDIIFESVPKFAAGGLVKRPTLGLIGEAGPELVIPLQALEDLAGANVDTALIRELERARGAFDGVQVGQDNALADAVAALTESMRGREANVAAMLQQTMNAGLDDATFDPHTAGLLSGALGSISGGRSDDDESAAETAENTKAMMEELRELRAEMRKLSEQPVVVNVEAKVGEDKAIDVLYKLMRTAKASGRPALPGGR